VDLRQHVDEATRENDRAALTEVIRAAGANPQEIPTSEAAEEILGPVYVTLRELHGDDLDMLQMADQPGVDKEKVCTLIRSFYGQILELPTESSGTVLRYLFSGT
jgi:hypothetical protein